MSYSAMWTTQNDQQTISRFAVAVETWAYGILTAASPPQKHLDCAKRIMSQDGAPKSYGQKCIKLSVVHDQTFTVNSPDTTVQSLTDLFMPKLANNDL